MATPSLHNFKHPLFLILVAMLLFSPAYAAENVTVHDQPYTQFEHFGVMFMIGFVFLVAAFIVDKNADAFAAMAFPTMWISAWMANQLDFPTTVIVSGTTDVTTYHHIYPSGFLSIVCVLLGIVALAQLYRIITSPDEVPSPGGFGGGAPRSREAEDEE